MSFLMFSVGLAHFFLLQTMTLMTQFILAMIMNPEVLAKAHEEIDRVVGNDRLPTFEDRPNLPYIECVMNESLRWGPSLPLSKDSA
jgi:cytochrome P450